MSEYSAGKVIREQVSAGDLVRQLTARSMRHSGLAKNQSRMTLSRHDRDHREVERRAATNVATGCTGCQALRLTPAG